MRRGKGSLYEFLGKFSVSERESGKHDLAGGVVEVSIGDERAELEVLSSAKVGGLDSGFLALVSVMPSTQI